MAKNEALKDLISRFYVDKTKADTYKKSAEAMNKEIKTIMTKDESLIVQDSKKRNNRIFETDDLVAEYYETVTEDMNQEALLEFLKEKGYKKAIKKIEIVDMDALENLIYNKKISTEDQIEMGKFTTEKSVAKLVVRKKKEAK